MTSKILSALAEQLNTLLADKLGQAGSKPFICIGNAPVYSSHAPLREAPDQAILTLAGFTGAGLINKRTTGFYSPGTPAVTEMYGLDFKIAFIADFSDANYLSGVGLMEEIFRLLYEQPIWMLPADGADAAHNVEILSDLGTRGEAGGFLRA